MSASDMLLRTESACFMTIADVPGYRLSCLRIMFVMGSFGGVRYTTRSVIAHRCVQGSAPRHGNGGRVADVGAVLWQLDAVSPL